MVRKLKLSNADLRFYNPLWVIILAFTAGVLGTVGFTVSWIAIELVFPPLFSVPNSLLIVVIIGAYGFAFLALFRNRILRRMARHGFLFVIRFQRFFESLFWAAILLAMYGYFARTGRIPEYKPALSLLFMGFYFPLAMPWLVSGRLIRGSREKRLWIMQFLAEFDAGRINYHWLKNGLSGVERHLRRLGYVVPKGGTYIWACFSLSQKSQLEEQLKFLGDWVRKPQVSDELDRLCTTITVQTRAAERQGYRAPRRYLDISTIFSLANLPKWWDNNVTAFFVFLIGSISLLLVSQSNLPSVPQSYALTASLAFLAVTLTAAYAIMRRKPPAQALKLVHDILPTVQRADDTQDEGHFWELAKLISEKQETIHSLGPALQIVAPRIFKELSAILSSLKVGDIVEPSPSPELSKEAFMNPQNRRLVSDLREDCEELLSKNAYNYPES